MKTAIRMGCVLAMGSVGAQAQMTVQIVPVRDNTLYEDAQGATSNGAGDGIFAGRASLNVPAPTRRAVLAFEFGKSIPQGALILDAELVLHMSRTIGGLIPMTLHDLRQPFGESRSVAPGMGGGGAPALPGDATWLHARFATTFWLNPGGDYDPIPVATTPVDGIGFYRFGGVALRDNVQRWIDQPASNSGWLLRGPELQLRTAKRFDSKEHANGAVHPMLRVVFATGPAARSTSFGMGCAGAGGTPLALTTIGAPRLGNANFVCCVSGGGPALPAFVLFSLHRAPNPLALSPGCFLYLDVPSALTLMRDGRSPLILGLLDARGQASVRNSIPLSPVLLGFAFAMQALTTGDSTRPLGLVTSNAVEVIFGV